MSYDIDLTDRVRELLLFEPDVTEKRMFGGLSFLIGGHIAVAVSRAGGLLLRADAEERALLLAEPHAHPAVMGGRTMSGWFRVDEEGVVEDDDLRRWVATGVALARGLPPS